MTRKYFVFTNMTRKSTNMTRKSVQISQVSLHKYDT